MSELNKLMANNLIERENSRSSYILLFGGKETPQYTKSPAMWNAALNLIGMEGAKYEVAPFEDDQGVARAIDLLKGSPIYLGGNVTQPFKETAFKRIFEVGELDDFAKKAESINTIVSRIGLIKGYNTDGPAEIKNLRSIVDKFSGLRVLVLGAGGAAKGIIPALLAEGASRVVIANRTKESAEYIARRMKGFYPDSEIAAIDDSELAAYATSGEFDLILNTTSVGQKKKETEGYSPLASTSLSLEENNGQSRKLFEQIARANPNTKISDLIYEPAQSPFLAQAEKSGLKTLNGKMMLVYQAADAFELVVGHEVGYDKLVETMERAYDQATAA